MLKLNNVIKESKKAAVFMFILNTINAIGKIHFDNDDFSINDLISHYAKEAFIARFEDDIDLFSAYINVALLLAFLYRMSTPFSTASSIDDILDNDMLSENDIIADCIGLMSKSVFEDDPENYETCASFLIDCIKESLEEDGYEFLDDSSEQAEPESSETSGQNTITVLS